MFWLATIINVNSQRIVKRKSFHLINILAQTGFRNKYSVFDVNKKKFLKSSPAHCQNFTRKKQHKQRGRKCGGVAKPPFPVTLASGRRPLIYFFGRGHFSFHQTDIVDSRRNHSRGRFIEYIWTDIVQWYCTVVLTWQSGSWARNHTQIS